MMDENEKYAARKNEDSSKNGVTSEIEAFKKELAQGIRNDVFEEEPINKDNKIVMIIISIALIILFFLLGYFIGMNAGLNNTDKCEDYYPINKKEEKKEDTNEIKEVDIDEEINTVYNLYHSAKDSSEYNEESFEGMMYSTKSFEIVSIKTIPSNIANIIKDKGSEEFNKLIKTDDDGHDYLDKSDAEPIIEKYMEEIFGKNLKFKTALFEDGCHPLKYDDGKYYYTSQCGGISTSTVKYKITKAEKDKDYLYITEEVTITSEDKEEDTTYTYKWKLNKDGNGNYIFLSSERQAK